MDCPACGSKLKTHDTAKGHTFQTCSKWPKCQISGTPALLNRFEWLRSEIDQLKVRLSESREQAGLLEDRVRSEEECLPCPQPAGELFSKLARLHVLQSQLNAAETDSERDRIREDARRVVLGNSRERS